MYSPSLLVLTITALAASQFGALSRAQLYAAGASPEAIRGWVDEGWLEPVTRKVFRVRAVPVTPQQLVMLAVLHIEGLVAASHDTAMAFYGVHGFLARGTVHVITTMDKARPNIPGVVVHRSRRLEADHITIIDGLPVTTPARCPFDVANLPKQLLRAVERGLDGCIGTRRATLDRIYKVGDRLLCRGRRGARRLRALLKDRPPGSAAMTSLERRASEVLRRGGLPQPRWQVDIGDGDEWIGRVDGIYDDCPLVLEIDSDVHHTMVSDVRADAARDALVERSGRLVARIPEHHVWYDADAMCAIVREARARAAAMKDRTS